MLEPYEDTLFLGMGGMHGSYASNMALTECDLLINLGSRFDDRLASKPDAFAPNAKIVHVDIDPSEINKVIHVDLGIIADCKRFLECLNDKNVKTIEHSDWLNIVKIISRNIHLNLVKKIKYFVSHNKQSNISAKLQMVKQLLLQTWDNIKCGQLNFIHLKITDNGLQAVV